MGAEPDPGGDVDTYLVEDVARKADRVITRRYRCPHIEGRARRLDRPAKTVQRVRDHMMPPLVHGACFTSLLLSPIQRLDGGPLHGLENAGVDIGLELPDQRHQVGPTTNPTDPPPRHVVGLRERVKFQANLFGAVDLEQAEWAIAAERNLGIWSVMAQHYAVTAAELDGPLQELTICHRCSGIVRVVEPHQPC